MSPTEHLKYMLLGGAGLVGIALILGVSLQNALYVGVLLACPLMMIFMMGGHGSEHDQAQSSDRPNSEPEKDDHASHADRM